MKKIIMALAISFIVSVVFTSMHCAQMAGKGWKKTLTLPSGEVVLDMRGEWDVLDEYLYFGVYKSLEIFGKPGSIIVLITQEGTTFSGVSQSDTYGARKGMENWKGILDKDGFKEVQAYAPQHGRWTWVPVTWEISEHGNKIVFVDRDRCRWTFTRR